MRPAIQASFPAPGGAWMAYSINDKCNGCSACKLLCPVDAISGERKEAHHINPLRCVNCGVCGRVCAQGAVLDDQGQPAVRIPANNGRYLSLMPTSVQLVPCVLISAASKPWPFPHLLIKETCGYMLSFPTPRIAWAAAYVPKYARWELSPWRCSYHEGTLC